MVALPQGAKLLATGVIAPFMVPLKVTLFVAFVIALPYVLWQLWGFIAPGPVSYTHLTQLPREFFLALANNARITLHIDNLRGINAHHQCESVFKSFGRAVRMACEYDPRARNVIPSTKGVL